ncbi:MAG: hypothetical protein ABIP13_00830, partial [Tepidiformaceae bacterium]
MMIFAALCGGAFAFTMVLWATGFGSISVEASARLGRLRNPTEVNVAAGGPSLRKRGAVRLGGINLISGGMAAKWVTDLERAGLSLKVREYLILRVVVGIVLTALGLSFSPIPQLAFLLFPVGFLAVGFWVKRRMGSRRRKLEAQLVEMLQMLSSGLRAGFGLIQSL